VVMSITEDQCMTFALFNTLDRVGKELFTCGGSMDPRDVGGKNIIVWSK
jgi:hypothetical protein